MDCGTLSCKNKTGSKSSYCINCIRMRKFSEKLASTPTGMKHCLNTVYGAKSPDCMEFIAETFEFGACDNCRELTNQNKRARMRKKLRVYQRE